MAKADRPAPRRFAQGALTATRGQFLNAGQVG